MRSPLRSIFIFLFVTAYYQARAEIGMGDWQCRTPDDHTIDNYSGNGYTLHLLNALPYYTVDKLSRWYFYKGFIVGERKDGYFIANEQTSVIDTFRDKKTWLTTISQKNLKPLFWTRWYTDRWSYLDDLSFFLFMNSYFLLPLAIIFLLLLYRAIRFEKFNIKKPCTLIILIIGSIVFIEYLSQQFPQSI